MDMYETVPLVRESKRKRVNSSYRLSKLAAHLTVNGQGLICRLTARDKEHRRRKKARKKNG